MPIPLQAVNLEPYARNPMLTAEQIGQGLTNMQAQAQRTASMQQQMAAQKQLAPIQLQSAQQQLAMQQDQMQAAKEKEALEQKYPAMAFGPAGQSMALLDYMQQDQGTRAAPPPQQGVPQNVPQTGNLMGIPLRPVSPSLSAQQSPQGMPTSGVPLAPATTPLASQGASFPTVASSLAQMPGQLPPVQMPMLGSQRPTMQAPSNVSNQVLGNLLTTQPGAMQPGNVPLSSQTGVQGGAPPPQNVNEFANDFVQSAVKRSQPLSASDLGINMKTPQAQATANAIISKMYPMSYAAMASNMLPMRAWEYMPSADRNAVLAMGVGYGLTRDSANSYFSRGGTLQALAKHTGIPVSQIQREFAPTTATISSEQRAGLAASALNSVDDQITGMIAPYAGQNVFGFNSKEMSNLVGKTNPTQLSNYLGASMARREQIMLQIQRAGGRPTEQQVHELAKVELANPAHLTEMMQNQFITPSIYQGAMNTFNKLGNDMYQGQHHYVQTTGTHKVLPSELTTTPPITKGAIGSQIVPAPKIPTFQTAAAKNKWFNSLSPAQQDQIFGGAS